MPIERTVEGLVRAKLTYLAQTVIVTDTIEMFRLEVVHMLKYCLFPEAEDDMQLEDPASYSFFKTSFISDIVAYLMIVRSIVESSTGTSETGGQAGTYLKKAKAGSAEAEFAAFEEGEGGASLGLKTEGLIGQLKDIITTKAGMLGCSLSWLFPEEDYPMPIFRVGESCGCGPRSVDGIWVNGIFIPSSVGKG